MVFQRLTGKTAMPASYLGSFVGTLEGHGRNFRTSSVEEGNCVGFTYWWVLGLVGDGEVQRMRVEHFWGIWGHVQGTSKA